MKDPKMKPLTSEEANTKIEETREQLIAAINAGDLERYRTLSVDQNFYAESLKAAEEREAADGAARADAARQALRPEAEEAARAAHPDVTFAGLLEPLQTLITQTIDAASALPSMIAAQDAANQRAMAICPRAGVAFQPFATGRERTNDFLARRIREHVERELVRVNATKNMPILPPIHFVR